MSQRALQVVINSVVVGSLIDENNVWGFQYAQSWLDQPQPYPLSPALPLNSGLLLDGSSLRPVQWFFDNLLPEEKLREVISKEEGIEGADAFGLLERLGAESAGALVLQPIGAPEADKGAVNLSYEVLSQRIRQLPKASLNKGAPKRMSLAGAQHKMVVSFAPESGRIQEPLKGSPSTHILKPDSTADAYPHSVVNETFTMRLAAAMGLAVPRLWRLYVPESVYIIERFDRKSGAGQDEPLRIHMLDGCQALNESSIYKYSSATFPKLLQLINICNNRTVARLTIFRWILFNTLVGNSDCHLKNISFLIDSEGMRVAPFYDLLCTAVYHTKAMAHENAVWPVERLAMPVEDADYFSEVTRVKLIGTGRQLGLSAGTALREIEKMVGRFAQAADELMVMMIAEYQSSPFCTMVSREIQGAELQLLRSIRHVVINDMLERVR